MADSDDIAKPEHGMTDERICQTVNHTILNSIDHVKVSTFFRERERYEIEITERKKEGIFFFPQGIPSLCQASTKVSIDQGVLRRRPVLGRLDCTMQGTKQVDINWRW